MIPAFLATFLWAGSTVCSSRAANLAGGTTAHFFRLVIAVAVLAVYALWLGQGLQGAGALMFLASGALGIGLGDFSAFHAYTRIGPRLTSLFVQCLSVPFAAVIEWLWLGTTLSANALLGGGIIITGTALALLQGISVPRSETDLTPQVVRHRLITGSLMAIAGALVQASGAVMTRRAFELSHMSGVPVDGMTAAFQRVCGGVLIMAVLFGATRISAPRSVSQATRHPGRMLRRALPWIFFSSLFGMVFGMGCFQWALEVSPTALVLSIIALTPLIVILMSWGIDGGRPTPLSIFACALAVSGVVVLLWH